MLKPFKSAERGIFAVVVAGAVLAVLFSPLYPVFATQTPVNLGTASTFAILAGTPNITDVPTCVITGNVGLDPATGAAIGIPCAEVTGTIYSVDNAGPLPCRVTNLGLLTTAKSDLDAAYLDAAGRIPTTTYPAIQDLGGLQLTPGVYNDPSSFGITGTLTLDAQGNNNAVFIFQAGSTLTTEVGSVVSLIHGAQACNVFWQVGSDATLKSNSTFKGTILALTDIALQRGANVEGRVLARNGAVTLIANTISVPVCDTPTGTKTTGPPTVGGKAYPINKAYVLVPWLMLALIIVIGSVLVLRRRTSR